jgi:hypothetical protein
MAVCRSLWACLWSGGERIFLREPRNPGDEGWRASRGVEAWCTFIQHAEVCPSVRRALSLAAVYRAASNIYVSALGLQLQRAAAVLGLRLDPLAGRSTCGGQSHKCEQTCDVPCTRASRTPRPCPNCAALCRLPRVRDLSSDPIGSQLGASWLTPSSRWTDLTTDRLQGCQSGSITAERRSAHGHHGHPKCHCAPGSEHAECLGALSKARMAVAH